VARGERPTKLGDGINKMSLKGVKMEKNWHAFNVIKIYK
jgi:hypothetical protein